MMVGNGRTPGPGQVPWPRRPGSAPGAVRQLTHPERQALTFKPCSARRRARHVARHPRSLHEAEGRNKVLTASRSAGRNDHSAHRKALRHPALEAARWTDGKIVEEYLLSNNAIPLTQIALA